MKKINFVVIALMLMLCVVAFTACDSRPELTLTTNIEGAGTVSGGGHFDYNEELFINAEVNNGYHFLGWYYDNDLLSTSAEYNCQMWDKDVTLEAKFIALPDDYDEEFGDMSPDEVINRNFKLSVVAGMPNYGKISVNDGDNEVQYSSSEKSGTNVKALALTTSSKRFLGWFDEAGNLVMSNGVFNFAMPSFDYTLTAKWECNCEYTYDALLKEGKCELCEGRISKNNLTSIIIPEGVTEISASEFDGCYKLTTIALPNSITKIEEKAFHECTGLKSITIPDSVTSIGSAAFNYCTSLTSVRIPNSVTSIGKSAFHACSSLTSVTIGNGVTSIGDGAFSVCTSLTSVYITDIAAWCNISFGDDYANPLYYADNLYLNGTLVTELIIPDGVTSIGSYAFIDCDSLTSVIIPDSVTSIGYCAFANCFSITIYCEVASEPSGWDSDWNSSNRPVVWGYKKT